MAMFTRAAKLDPGAHGVKCTRTKTVHNAVGISGQRNIGYRPNRVNIMAHNFSTSLSRPTSVYIAASASNEYFKRIQIIFMLLESPFR